MITCELFDLRLHGFELFHYTFSIHVISSFATLAARQVDCRRTGNSMYSKQ